MDYSAARLICFESRCTTSSVVITSAKEADDYVMRHSMLALENLILGANAVGLDCSPMEGFDEDRLKRLLAIPSRIRVCAVVAIGRRLDDELPPETYRVPVTEKTWRERYGRR